MARKPNYGFEKHLKEQRQQKKREEKAEKKRLKKEEAVTDERAGERADTELGYSSE